MTLWEILKANKTGIAPDMFTMLAASKMNGSRDRLYELSGIPPLSFTAKGKPLTAWSITGNTVQNGTPTPENPVEVQAVGDRTGNLFDYKKYFESTFTKYSEYFEWAEIQLKPFTTYTFTTSFSESTTATGVINTAFIITTSTEEPSTLTGGISSTRIATKTTEADGIIKIYKRIRGNYLPKKEDFDSGMYWLMINEGDTALPYEPYGYKIPVVTSADGTEPITTPIYLDKPLYKIGDYADSINYAEQKVERVVKELVLTGKENWYYMPNYDVENTVRIHSLGILLDRKGTMLDLCSHFERMDYHSLNVSNKPAFSIASGTQLVFRVSKAEGSAVTYFKSYLAAQYAAGTPVKVYYVLATPETKTVEPVKIPTLNGTTVIDVDTAVKPESMTIKYRR